MTGQLNTADYYRNRERQERDIAALSTSPAIAEIHVELAERYAELIKEAVEAEGRAARVRPLPLATPLRLPSLARPRLKLSL